MNPTAASQLYFRKNATRQLTDRMPSNDEKAPLGCADRDPTSERNQVKHKVRVESGKKLFERSEFFSRWSDRQSGGRAAEARPADLRDFLCQTFFLAAQKESLTQA
jgi:hypothetical protein